jgi:hypothetical protein
MKLKLLLFIITYFLINTAEAQTWLTGGNGIQYYFDSGGYRHVRQALTYPQAPFYVTDSLAKYRPLINNVFTGNLYTSKNAPVFFEFRNNNAPGTTKASVGALGNGGEANLSWNMDYTTGMHKYYDSTKNAMWLALGSAAWAMQYAPSGSPTSGDMWNDTGSKYLVWGDTNGRLVLNSSISDDKGDAQLVINRRASFASVSGGTDLVISGNKTKGTSGAVYMNPYDSGNIFLGSGTGKVGVKNLAPAYDLDVTGTINSSSYISAGLGLSSNRNPGTASIKGVTDLVVDGNDTTGPLFLNQYSTGATSIGIGGGLINIGVAGFKSAKGVKFTRNPELPSIVGASDLVLDGDSTTNGDVFLNAYSSGDVYLNQGGGKTTINRPFTYTPVATLDVNGTGNFTGILSVLTASPGTNTTQAASTAFTANAISGKANLVGGNAFSGGDQTLSGGTKLGIAIVPVVPLHVKGEFRSDRVSGGQYTQIDSEAGATTILSKNTTNTGYAQMLLSQGNNTTNRTVINIDGTGKTIMAFGASVATAPSASIDVVRKLELDTKQNALTLTTTGSGAATLVGATLNIPTPSLGTVTSGTYSPTFTNLSGTPSVNSTTWYYMRIGNIVMVQGYVTATALLNTSGNRSIDASLPIATTNSVATGSMASSYGTDVNTKGDVGVNVSNLTVAKLRYFEASTSNSGVTLVVSFTYTIQ